MDALFWVAGIVYILIGTIAIIIVSGVYVAVRFFGAILTFGFIKDKMDNKDEIDRGQMDREG